MLGSAQISSQAFKYKVLKLADVDAIIRTNRLELIPLIRDHAERLFPVLAEVSLYEYTQEPPPTSLETLRGRYSFLQSRRSPDGSEVWLNWLVQESDSGEAIGYVQATVTPGAADVAWVVGLPWQGQGYATEAARAMVFWLQSAGAGVVRATISSGHSASQRVAAKVGFLPTEDVADGEDVWILAAGQERRASRSGRRRV